MGDPMRCLAILTAVLAPFGAAAETTLTGRTAEFSVLAYDDPDLPLYVGEIYSAIVSDDVEFGLEPEGPQNGLDVVPVVIDIDAERIELDYRAGGAGPMATTMFNGYVLSFTPDCVLFDGAHIDKTVTNVPLTDKDLYFEGRTLRIDLSGKVTTPQSRIAIDLDVADCPIM